MNKFFLISTVLPILLAGCGGGGGGSPSSVGATPSTPSPVVNVSISSPKISVGSSAIVTWTSANATTCFGSGEMNGPKAINNSSIVTPTFGGIHTYSISCSGAGGTSEKSVSLLVPMPTLGSSYENKNNILMDDPTIVSMRNVENIDYAAAKSAGEQDWSGRSFAFGDFLQEGQYSAIALSTVYKNIYPGFNIDSWPDSPAKIYFLKKDKDSGRWLDTTSSLIKDAASRFTCVTPSYVEVADLNNDGKPDAYIACTGVDFPLPNKLAHVPSDQYVVLSQPDGTYKVTPLAIDQVYGHKASLVDLNGDGNIDILSVDPQIDHKPFVLWGNGDGTFKKDMSLFPDDIMNTPTYGIYAIPVNGKINIFVSGFPSDSMSNPSSWDQSHQYGFKRFEYTNGALQFTQDITPIIPKASKTGLRYGLVIDLLYKDGYYYAFQVTSGYNDYAITRYNLDSSTSNTMVENYMSVPYAAPGLLKATSSNIIVQQVPFCSYSYPQQNYAYEGCKYKLQLK